mgnify:CR=1 FL=1
MGWSKIDSRFNVANQSRLCQNCSGISSSTAPSPTLTPQLLDQANTLMLHRLNGDFDCDRTSQKRWDDAFNRAGAFEDVLLRREADLALINFSSFITSTPTAAASFGPEACRWFRSAPTESGGSSAGFNSMPWRWVRSGSEALRSRRTRFC